MDLTDEFLKHAGDCERMAEFTRDPASKLSWTEMAKKFHRYAEKFASQSLAVRDPMTKRDRDQDSHSAGR
jgi:hypothetical protein